jgi:hypothetical protein
MSFDLGTTVDEARYDVLRQRVSKPLGEQTQVCGRRTQGHCERTIA